MPQLLRTAAVLLAALVSASADCVPTVEHTIYIEDDLGSPIVGAGPLLERVLITANGTIPGPEIRVKVHDCVKVRGQKLQAASVYEYISSREFRASSCDVASKASLKGVELHLTLCRQCQQKAQAHQEACLLCESFLTLACR
jgi:hypothetical protein